ncbi:MAG: ATP-binding protein [Leptolyngbyaceae cyanobacterium RM2_2_4]|nr:ATP-binding protein [Leptolyngbyaceae cyanobacterium RM2_2_4]
MMTSTSELLGFSMLSRLAELRNAWEQDYSERTQGGLLALSGFEYQFLLTLLKIVYLWKASTDAERQDLETARKILAEAISDITESGRDITFTQVKRTLSASGLRSALEELWEIFQLASERTPDLAEHLRFVISGQFEGHENPQQVIQGWRTQSDGYSQQELRLFKARVRHDLVPDPRSDLSTELQVLARDENTETTIARWLGYLLQLGSGFSPESISTFIWKELANDGSVEAFRATLARLLSLSHSRLCVIRETLGDNITLPRAKLSDLRASLFKKNITLLIGSSGSGKSALCKAGIQQDFKQNFDCLFLHASDIASFTESSDVIANRGLRRLDELLIARITQKPTLVVIDDLSDVDDQHFDAVLNLLHNTLTADPLSDVRFILVAHVDARRRIHEKISARFGNDSVYDDVELPQLPVEELVCSEALPDSVISLIQRHHEFGPALNLKLIDWLVRSAQRKQVDTAVFQSDLDLLTWFWHDHVQDSQDSSNLGQVLIRIAKELADIAILNDM